MDAAGLGYVDPGLLRSLVIGDAVACDLPREALEVDSKAPDVGIVSAKYASAPSTPYIAYLRKVNVATRPDAGTDVVMSCFVPLSRSQHLQSRGNSNSLFQLPSISASNYVVKVDGWSLSRAELRIDLPIACNLKAAVQKINGLVRICPSRRRRVYSCLWCFPNRQQVLESKFTHVLVVCVPMLCSETR